MNTQTANHIACRIAAHAHASLFSERRGVLWDADSDRLAYFNNNPYGDRTIRPREIASFEADLDRIGVSVIGRGTAGPAEHPEYTICLLLDCTEDILDDVITLSDVAAAKIFIEALEDSDNWKSIPMHDVKPLTDLPVVQG